MASTRQSAASRMARVYPPAPNVPSMNVAPSVGLQRFQHFRKQHGNVGTLASAVNSMSQTRSDGGRLDERPLLFPPSPRERCKPPLSSPGTGEDARRAEGSLPAR